MVGGIGNYCFQLGWPHLLLLREISAEKSPAATTSLLAGSTDGPSELHTFSFWLLSSATTSRMSHEVAYADLKFVKASLEMNPKAQEQGMRPNPLPDLQTCLPHYYHSPTPSANSQISSSQGQPMGSSPMRTSTWPSPAERESRTAQSSTKVGGWSCPSNILLRKEGCRGLAGKG